MGFLAQKELRRLPRRGCLLPCPILSVDLEEDGDDLA